jgi:RNA recognition motif-containing protein
MKKLFVSNLNFNANENDLASAFEQYGPVTDVKVIFDRETNRSRGFGFVTFENGDDANRAKSELNETEFMGRQLKVDIATERPRHHQAGEKFGNNRNERY